MWGATPAGALALLLSGAAALAADSAACRQPPLASGVVRSIGDDGTLLLDDGRSVRLDAIAAAPMAAPAPPLAALAGRTVALEARDPAPDRYGRLRAFVLIAGEEAAGPLQYALLARGGARVTGRGVEPACRAALLARERQARNARLGIWADPAYAVRRADEPDAVRAARGRLALVEGRVLSVRESGGTVYLNFGRRWSEDFTVTIAKRNQRIFTAAGLPPKRLEQRQVRVRGWIEERGGPWIDMTGPEQIEIVGSE